MATEKNLLPTTCPIHGDGIWTALKRKSYFKCGCNRYEFIDCPKCGAKRWLNLSFECGTEYDDIYGLIESQECSRRQAAMLREALSWMGRQIADALHAIGSENNLDKATEILYSTFRRYFDELEWMVRVDE